jgi:hypothetical protein
MSKTAATNMNTTRSSSFSFTVKTNPQKRPLTFGDFVAGGYRAWGKDRAEGIIRLAIKSRLIEFCGDQRFMIS